MTDLTEECARIRDETADMQRKLDEITYRMRELVGDSEGKMLIELIDAARKLLNDERNAKLDAAKVCQFPYC